VSETTHELTAKDGKSYTVRVPAGVQGLPSSYLFAFVKSGSTLMDNMMAEYCSVVGVPHFSLFDQAFAQGIRTVDIRADANRCLGQPGIVYSGFRHYPSFNLRIGNSNVVLLVRDPRDMLVSLYFSIMKSHIIPAGNESLRRAREQIPKVSIDEFVLQRAQGYVSTFRRYRNKLRDTNHLVFRYEDVIYEKADWLADMVSFTGLPTRPRDIRRIAKHHDKRPEQENVSSHIRQVHPGNFRKKLSEATIRELSDATAEFLDAFDYPRG